jgi:histidine ammonia-lyase
MAVVTITDAPLTIEELLAVAGGARIELSDDAGATIAASRAVIDRMLEGDRPVYGLNTGVGHMKDSVLPIEGLRSGQVLILMTHAGGTGPPLPTERVRGELARWVKCGSRCGPSPVHLLPKHRLYLQLEASGRPATFG